jgi:hypothetical protein
MALATAQEAVNTNIFHNLSIDFTPFRNIISKIFLNTTQLPTNDCNIPNKAVMFSYTNHHLFFMIELQRRAMEITNSRKCLEQRYITICLDSKCMLLCGKHNIPNCVQLEFPTIPLTVFGKGLYHYLTWVKHEFMYEALQVADEIFFFDSDVLIFRNPWPEVKYERINKEGKRNITIAPYDIMYQRERGIWGGLGCGGTVNTGQVYILNSTEIQKYFKILLQRKNIILKNHGMLDQDHVNEIISDESLVRLKRCTLSVRNFHGYCTASKDATSPLKEIITFHTTCLSGNAKHNVLQKMYNNMKANYFAPRYPES